MRKTLMISIVFLLVFGIAGCRNVSGTGQVTASPFHSTAFGDSARVQVEGLLLSSVINVERVDSERIEGDLLKVYVAMHNTSSKGKWVKIKTRFLDSDMHQLEQTNWEPFFVGRRSTVEYTCTSMSNQAADYQVVIHENK